MIWDYHQCDCFPREGRTEANQRKNNVCYAVPYIRDQVLCKSDLGIRQDWCGILEWTVGYLCSATLVISVDPNKAMQRLKTETADGHIIDPFTIVVVVQQAIFL